MNRCPRAPVPPCLKSEAVRIEKNIVCGRVPKYLLLNYTISLFSHTNNRWSMKEFRSVR